MSWLNGISREEHAEIFTDACDAFQKTIITEKEFRETLAKLGFNATDIEDEVRRNAPQP